MSFDPSSRSAARRGNILLVLFAAVGMVGVIGVASMNVLKGPVKTMAEVTRRTIAENQMLASGKLALVTAAQQPGDCDADGLVEPPEWVDPDNNPAPRNGGWLPPTIGASLQDPWGSTYGYCAWDHGALSQDDLCGAGARRLAGGEELENPVIAVISAGPDRRFQTECQPFEDGGRVVKAPGSDDLVLAYSFAEAKMLAGGLWNLKEGDLQTATISKNLSVTDMGGQEQFTFDAAARALAIGDGGTGSLPNIRTDYIQNLTGGAPVEFLANIKMGGAWISGDGGDKGLKISPAGDASLSGDIDAAGMVSADTATFWTEDENAIAAIVTSSGDDGIGLKAIGALKAIEAEGLLDMTGNNIINVAEPLEDNDAATKKYVDDKFGGGGKKVRCEAFVFSGCSGGTTTNLVKTTLGDCKKACEDLGARCCHAQFATIANNPEVPLGKCVGHVNGGTSGTLSNLVLGLLFPANVAAYCYEQSE